MTFQEYFDKEWLEFGAAKAYYVLPLILIAGGLFIRWLSRPKLHRPPGPVGLPLVGYLFSLGKEPFKTLDNLKKKYGNVMSLPMGRKNVIILGDCAAVEEAFSKAATLDRPPGVFDFLPDGFGLGSANGVEWVEQRRFFLRTMKDLGLGRDTWASLVEDEVSDFVKVIASKNGQPMDIYKFLTPSVSNNIASLAFGKRFPPGETLDSLNAAFDTIMIFFGQSSLWNYYPRLCKILAKLRIGTYYKTYKEMVYVNNIMRKEAELKKSHPGTKGSDFISQFLEVMQANESQGKRTTFNERNLFGDTQALFIGGSDTTRTALSWLFLTMATFPKVQQKVQEELKSVLGEKTRALWEDRLKFPYTYAVIMETQRWRTIVPLNSSRMSSEDVKLSGYDIQKGTTIIANFWGLHNDPKYWPEPEKFIPERFLRNGGKEVNLKPDSYAPFSYGKRKCPGEVVALMEIFLYFTAIMKLFEVRAPDGRKPVLEGILGLTYRPAAQDLCFVPRQQIPQDI